MNRLQKKCLLVSAGLHLLLGLILVVGPAFMTSESKPDNMPVLNFVPLKTVDALMSGGGDPTAKPPPATFEKPQPLPPAPPAQPKPAPPVEVEQPDKPREVVKEPEPIKETPEFSLVPAKDHKKKPEFDFTVVKHPTVDPKEEAKRRAEAEARDAEREYRREYDAWRRGAAAAVRSAGNRLADGVSGSTDIKLFGPGGGGVPYANFYQAVKSVYEHAWIVPDGLTDTSGTVTTSITIARDGAVTSARITRSSGNEAVDRSVEVTLERVKYAAPLPDSETSDHRTIEIKFNVAAHRAMG